MTLVDASSLIIVDNLTTPRFVSLVEIKKLKFGPYSEDEVWSRIWSKSWNLVHSLKLKFDQYFEFVWDFQGKFGESTQAFCNVYIWSDCCVRPRALLMIGANKNRHDLNFDIAIGKLESLQFTGRGGLGKKALFGGIHNLTTGGSNSHLRSFFNF